MHSIFQVSQSLTNESITFILIFGLFVVVMSSINAPRFNKVVTALSAIVLFEMNYFDCHFDNCPTFVATIELFSTIVWGLIFFKGGKLKVALSSFFLIVIILLTDTTVFLINTIFNFENNETEFFLFVNPMICVEFLVFSLFYSSLLLFIWNKATKNGLNLNLFQNTNSVIIFIVSEACSLFTIVAFIIYIEKKYPGVKQAGIYGLFIVYFVALLLSNIIIFYSIKNNNKVQRLKYENEMLKYQSNLQTEYYEKIQKNIDSTAKIRHDINNLLQVVNILINENSEDSRNQAIELTEEINEIIDSTRTQAYCNNRIINTVLFDKLATAKSLGIKIIDDVIISDDCGINNLDLCRIFVNILDNGINALKSCEGKKTMTISCHQEEDTIYIKAQNAFSNEKKGKKEKDPAHGHGLKIIEEIVNKYNGTFSTKTEENIFSILLSVKTKA